MSFSITSVKHGQANSRELFHAIFVTGLVARDGFYLCRLTGLQFNPLYKTVLELKSSVNRAFDLPSYEVRQ